MLRKLIWMFATVAGMFAVTSASALAEAERLGDYTCTGNPSIQVNNSDVVEVIRTHFAGGAQAVAVCVSYDRDDVPRGLFNARWNRRAISEIICLPQQIENGHPVNISLIIKVYTEVRPPAGEWRLDDSTPVERHFASASDLDEVIDALDIERDHVRIITIERIDDVTE